MDQIKSFFSQKKLDKKFKKAGTGHTLANSAASSDNASSSVRSSSHDVQSSSRPSVAPSQPSSESAALAGQAALMRIEKKFQDNQPQSSISKAAKAQAQRELEEERKAKEAAYQSSVLSSKTSERQFESAPVLECILLVCPFCSDSFGKQSIDNHMHECLKQQMSDAPSVVSVTMFLSCNRNPEKLAAGKDIFIRVFSNLIKNASDEKFQKLKCSTNAYKDKIQPMLGHEELLQAAGFSLQNIPTNEPDTSERAWVNCEPNVELLENLVTMLNEGQAMKPSLDRQAKLLHPKDILSVGPIYYPDDFYNLSKEEIAREHQIRRERAEKELQLRTKAMRERDAQQEVRKYNYTLIRIRLPNNIILQAVFRAFEKFGDVVSYLRSNLAYDCVPFSLLDATGQSFDETSFLSDLGLVPAAVLNFHWDDSILRDVIEARKETEVQFLSNEFLSQLG